VGRRSRPAGRQPAPRVPLRGAGRRACMEQNFGPHIEQKCAVLAGSCGSVASWNRRAVTGSSDRLNWSYLRAHRGPCQGGVRGAMRTRRDRSRLRKGRLQGSLSTHFDRRAAVSCGNGHVCRGARPCRRTSGTRSAPWTARCPSLAPPGGSAAQNPACHAPSREVPTSGTQPQAGERRIEPGGSRTRTREALLLGRLRVDACPSCTSQQPTITSHASAHPGVYRTLPQPYPMPCITSGVNIKQDPARLGQVGRVRRDLVRDDAGLDVVAVGQAQVLLRRHVAQQRGACAPPAAAPGSAGCGRAGRSALSLARGPAAPRRPAQAGVMEACAARAGTASISSQAAARAAPRARVLACAAPCPQARTGCPTSFLRVVLGPTSARPGI